MAVIMLPLLLLLLWAADQRVLKPAKPRVARTPGGVRKKVLKQAQPEVLKPADSKVAKKVEPQASNTSDSQALKIMFFGDTVISGVHNKENVICPFRYEFLRLIERTDKRVQVVGTNADPEGTCQKHGEKLDVHNNGYKNAGIDELLDLITADLQYLHKPVDYIFSSVGAEDCLQWVEGRDYQFLSQSIRRIMGRLLNINENAKLFYVPIMLPETAGSIALECMTVVNKKLEDVYSDLHKDTRIYVLNLTNKYGPESFHIIDKDGKNVNEQASVATSPVNSSSAVVVRPDTSAEKPVVSPPTVEVAPKQPVVGPGVMPPTVVTNPKSPAIAPPQTEVSPKPNDSKPVQITSEVSGTSKPPTAESKPSVVVPAVQNQEVDSATGNKTRRLDVSVMFLPNQQLSHEIVIALLNALDWGFRAQTFHPTPKVTKPPEYYGYEWCMKHYDHNVCFEYYYGYTWCLEHFDNNECYSYYYGNVKHWGKNESYKWCLNFYDQEYCQFAYMGEKPDTWDWLSFGYHDCLKNHSVEDCSEQFYNTKQHSVKTPEKPVKVSTEKLDYGVGNVLLSLLISVALFGCLVWVTWKKFSCCKPKYSRLDLSDKGKEDEVELL
jgi:hypothetical protein